MTYVGLPRRAARVARDRGRSAIRQRINFTGHAKLDDRRRGADRVLLVLTGYKPHLWPHTLTRIARFAPAELDVCLVSAGTYSSDLAEIAATNRWSYLAVRERNISLAQNLAIRAHGHAQWVFKLDEDIFIESGYFEGLFAGYRRISEAGEYRVGICAPTLNVNGFSYVDFLQALGLEDEYRLRFGELVRGADRIRAWGDGEAAVWLWEHALPLDATAALFGQRPFGYSTVPHRFSIGAVLYERALWEAIGGFQASVPRRLRVGLGDDEAHVYSAAGNLSRVICVVHNVFAAHFAFGPQDAEMRQAFPRMVPRLISDSAEPQVVASSPSSAA